MKDPLMPVKARGKIMVCSLGTSGPLPYDGKNERVRAALSDDPKVCSTLAIYVMKIRFPTTSRYISTGGDYTASASLFVFDLEKDDAAVYDLGSSVRSTQGLRDPWEVIERMVSEDCTM